MKAEIIRSRVISAILTPVIFCALAGCETESETIRIGELLYRAAINDAPKITLEQAAAVPYATLALAIGSSGQVMLVLGDSGDPEIQTWYGGQQIFIATRAGRVVRTAGLPHDLGGLSVLSVAAADSTVRYTVDFPDLGIYGALANCTPADGGAETIQILGSNIEARRTIEHCTVEAMKWRFDDEFWSDAAGFVWRSRQYVHPDLDPLVLDVLRPPSPG